MTQSIFSPTDRKPLPEPRRCCGAWTTPGLRYGPTPQPVPVQVCWEGCGAEWPPLFVPVETCSRGHAWTVHGRISRDGWRYCQRCKAWSRALRRAS